MCEKRKRACLSVFFYAFFIIYDKTSRFRLSNKKAISIKEMAQLSIQILKRHLQMIRQPL